MAPASRSSGGEGIRIYDGYIKTVSTSGAGIGNGDQSGVSLGAVTISHSTVTATGGAEAAGIGTGNESTVKAFNIEIKDHSIVTATGGEYGKGGEVSIRGESNVYAEGKHYGAGIGGGEDGDGDAFLVSGRSTVEAVAGSDGWGKAVGYGDFNVFSVPSTGSVSISNGLRVKAGKSSDNTEDYVADDRFDAIRNYKYAKIYPCGHERAALKYHDYSAHGKYCADCKEWVYDSYEDHIWDDDYVCTVCGGTATLATMTIEQKDSDGSVMTEQTTAPLHTDFTLPECTSAPDGKAFVCWRDKIHMDCYAPGETVMLENTTFEAIYMTLEETPFIDADGSQQTVPARVFDGTDEALVLTDGWYVFKGTHEFQEKIRIKGNISMILEDGCLFKGCVPDSGLTLIESRSVAVLSLYGQSGQTGTLDIASNRFTVTDLRLYGGVVRSERSFGGKLSTYIKGGTVSAQSLTNPKFGTVISGGNVTTTGKSILVNDYEFGWSSITDSISLGGFMPQGSKGSIIITDGQAFADEDGDIYVDSLSYDQIMALEGKTLTPYFNYHQYGESEWVWSEHNDEATAVFTCTKEGCGDVRRVEAKVDFNVDGDNGVYTAECTFFGQKYTTEKRVTLRHGITINVNGGGTVTAGQEKPKAGDDVELTVTPDSGYTLWSLSVTDAEGSEVWVDGNIFEMPNFDVTVTAEFIAVVPERSRILMKTALISPAT